MICIKCLEECLAGSKLYKNVCWLNKRVFPIFRGLMGWRVGVEGKTVEAGWAQVGRKG